MRGLSGFSRITLIAVVLLVAATVAGGLAYRQWQAAQRALLAAAEQAANQALAADYAATVAKRVALYQTALARLAETEAARNVLTGRIDAGRFVASAGERIPPHLALRILEPIDLPVDDGVSPPLSFASIDMMQQAIDRKGPVPVEFHALRELDDGGYFALVQPVLGAADPAAPPRILGFLHLSLARADLLPDLTAATAPDQVMQVIQSISGASGFVLARSGPAALPTAELAQEVRVAGSPLLIRVASLPPPPSGFAFDPEYAAPLAILGGLALVWVLVRRRSASRGDAARVQRPAELAGAIQYIMTGSAESLRRLVTEPEVNPGLFPSNQFATPNASDPSPVPTASAHRGPSPANKHVSASNGEPPMSKAQSGGAAARPVDPSIFRTYDIRGVVDETLNEETVYLIGRALGSEAARLDQAVVVLGRDGRLSSPDFNAAMLRGLLESGRNVIDIGLVPSPLLYFATHYLNTPTGIMITGSHNPGNYNGIKMVMAGRTLSGDEIQALRRRVDARDFVSGEGSVESVEILSDYIRRVSEEIPLSLGRSLKVIVDCGNGVPGLVAPSLLRAIGHDVEELYCEVDGHFPNHHPDPSQPKNLEDLIACVRGQGADLGLAFDGDGDRLGVVDANGNIIWPDRQMVLFAREVLSRNPGAPIIFDVKCTGRLADAIREAGGEPVMYKTGHSLIKAKMQEIGAPLAGEMSGHIFFKDRWYGFDDALYSACRLLEILVNSAQSPAEIFAALPAGVSTPELKLPLPESRHAEFMQNIFERADFGDATITDTDGLRVDFPDSWGLIRPSNTTPCLVMRFEGDTAEALSAVQEKFRALIMTVDPAAELPF